MARKKSSQKLQETNLSEKRHKKYKKYEKYKG